MSDEPSSPRQRVVRVPGARRAKLTRVEGTHGEPHERDERPTPPSGAASGANDERMLRDVPPHY